jgi:hypothetical protein
LNRLTFPAPAGLLIVVAVGVTALTLVQSLSLLTWAYADWTSVSALPRQVLTLVGPWIAAGAAWLASTFVSDRTVLAPKLALRRGGGLVLRHITVLVIWVWLGLILGLAPAWIEAARSATWGGLDAVILVSGLMALSCAVAFGYTIGTILPLLASVPVAVVLTFVATVFYSGATGSVTSPTYPFGVVAGLHEPYLTGLTRTFYFALICAFLIFAGSCWIRTSTKPFDVKGRIPLLLAALAVLALTHGLNTRDTPLVVRESETEPVCSRGVGVRTCVHPAREVMLGDVATATSEIRKLVGPAFPLDEVFDSTLWQPEDPRIASLQLQSETREWRAIVRADIAVAVTNASLCASQGFGASSGGVASPATVSQALTLWIAREVGAAEAIVGASARAEGLAKRLDKSDVGEVQDKLRIALPDIRACRGEVADIL